MYSHLTNINDHLMLSFIFNFEVELFQAQMSWESFFRCSLGKNRYHLWNEYFYCLHFILFLSTVIYIILLTLLLYYYYSCEENLNFACLICFLEVAVAGLHMCHIFAFDRRSGSLFTYCIKYKERCSPYVQKGIVCMQCFLQNVIMSGWLDWFWWPLTGYRWKQLVD